MIVGKKMESNIPVPGIHEGMKKKLIVTKKKHCWHYFVQKGEKSLDG